MARIRNNYPYAWSSVQILQCTPNWNIDIKSRTMYIQMLFLAPPPRHTRYILPVSVNLPLLTTLGSYRFPTHVHSFSPCFDLLVSQLHNPFFHSVTKCIYLTHPPLHPMPSSLSLSLSLSPSRAKYMHCLSSPPTSRAHARTLYI